MVTLVSRRTWIAPNSAQVCSVTAADRGGGDASIVDGYRVAFDVLAVVSLITAALALLLKPSRVRDR